MPRSHRRGERLSTGCRLNRRLVSNAATAALARKDWSADDPESYLRSMVDLERMQAHLDAAKVALTGRIVARQVAEQAGWANAKDFLTAAAGGPKGSGPSLVRLATRLEGLPRTREALASGVLSRAKAQVIASRIATLPHHSGLRAAAEGLLLEAAGHLDATDLWNSWPGVVQEIDPEGELPGSEQALDKLDWAAHRARHLGFVPDGYGGCRIRGYASMEEAELVKATLQANAAPVSTEPGACGGDPHAPVGSPAGTRRGSCPDPECGHTGRPVWIPPPDTGVRLTIGRRDPGTLVA